MTSINSPAIVLCPTTPTDDDSGVQSVESKLLSMLSRSVRSYRASQERFTERDYTKAIDSLQMTDDMARQFCAMLLERLTILQSSDAVPPEWGVLKGVDSYKVPPLLDAAPHMSCIVSSVLEMVTEAKVYRALLEWHQVCYLKGSLDSVYGTTLSSPSSSPSSSLGSPTTMTSLYDSTSKFASKMKPATLIDLFVASTSIDQAVVQILVLHFKKKVDASEDHRRILKGLSSVLLQMNSHALYGPNLPLTPSVPTNAPPVSKKHNPERLSHRRRRHTFSEHADCVTPIPFADLRQVHDDVLAADRSGSRKHSTGSNTSSPISQTGSTSSAAATTEVPACDLDHSSRDWATWIQGDPLQFVMDDE